MGCDIHIWIELKAEVSGDNETAPRPWRLCMDENATYHDRNYNLFAWLADVRNSRSGIDRIVPLDDPRGVPDDVSKPVREDIDRWGPDLHSHTHFLVSEILDDADVLPEHSHDFVMWLAALCIADDEHREKHGVSPRRGRGSGTGRLIYYPRTDLRLVIAFDN